MNARTLGERSEDMGVNVSSMEVFKEQLKSYILENDQLLSDLKLVRALDLPDCCIAAGYIRNYIWDRLHGFGVQNNHSDIDVVYFYNQDLSEERDWLLERHLRTTTGNEKWSVKNQARMHIRNEDNPYSSTENAMAHWPETATAIGIRIDFNNDIVLTAPYGVDDLFGLKVRQSPLFKDRSYFLERIMGKKWLSTWPNLKLVR